MILSLKTCKKDKNLKNANNYLKKDICLKKNN